MPNVSQTTSTTRTNTTTRPIGVHLVRHGAPAIDEAVPAADWTLDPGGLAEVDRLRDSGVLPAGPAVWFSSTEPKAVATAARLAPGHDVVRLADLREAERPAGWFDRDVFTATVARSLEQPDWSARQGWETARSVHDRVVQAFCGPVIEAAYEQRVDEIVLIGHGTAWTVLVAAITQHQPDLAGWRGLTMPDHCRLEVYSDGRNGDLVGRIVRPWGSWRLLGA